MLQILIVFAIAAVVAGISMPSYASRAKDVVLEQNMANLKQQIERAILQDEDSSMTGDTLGADVTRALGNSEAGRYVNPVSGSTDIVSQPSPPKASAAAGNLDHDRLRVRSRRPRRDGVKQRFAGGDGFWSCLPIAVTAAP